MWFPTLSSGHYLVSESWKSLLFVLSNQLGFSSPSCQLLAVSQRTGWPGAPRALCAAQTFCTLSRPPWCCPSPGHAVPVAGIWSRMDTGIPDWPWSQFLLDWERNLKILAEQWEKNGFACAQVKKLGADSQFVFTYSSGTWTPVILYVHCLSITPWHLKFPCCGGVQITSGPHIRSSYLVWGPFVLFLIAGSDSWGLIQWLWTWKNLPMITTLFCPAWIYDMLWSSFSANQELGVVVSHQNSQVTAKNWSYYPLNLILRAHCSCQLLNLIRSKNIRNWKCQKASVL